MDFGVCFPEQSEVLTKLKEDVEALLAGKEETENKVTELEEQLKASEEAREALQTELNEVKENADKANTGVENTDSALEELKSTVTTPAQDRLEAVSFSREFSRSCGPGSRIRP